MKKVSWQKIGIYVYVFISSEMSEKVSTVYVLESRCFAMLQFTTNSSDVFFHEFFSALSSWKRNHKKKSLKKCLDSELEIDETIWLITSY